MRINTGESHEFREYVYDAALFERAVREAGLILLGTYDAEQWHAPGKYSARLDFVAVKPPAETLAAAWPQAEARARNWIAADAVAQD